MLDDHSDGGAGRTQPGRRGLLAFGALVNTASFLFGKLGVRTRGWLLRGAALTIVALGFSTLWRVLAYFGVVPKLANS